MNRKTHSFIPSAADLVLEINWSAIVSNLNYFRKQMHDSTKLMLMVKANGYGHGAVALSSRFQTEKLTDYLGVAKVEEGIELRKNGIHLPIMVQNVHGSQWSLLVEHCLEPVIHHFEGLSSFNNHLSGKEYPVHLKVNTGMNRLGFDEHEVDKLIKVFKHSSLKIRSVMSHLSSAGDEDEEEFTQAQIQLFNKICNQLKPILEEDTSLQLLNTAGTGNYAFSQLDMVRIGIGIFGASTNEKLKHTLTPVSAFKTRVTSVRKVPEGASISYNRKGIASEKTNIAVLSLGYADGFLRKLGNGNWLIEINDKLYPTIGNVCMDLCMVNLGNDMVEVGTEAIIWGGKRSIFDYSEALGTIAYEAGTLLGRRVKRVFL